MHLGRKIGNQKQSCSTNEDKYVTAVVKNKYKHYYMHTQMSQTVI